VVHHVRTALPICIIKKKNIFRNSSNKEHGKKNCKIREKLKVLFWLIDNVKSKSALFIIILYLINITQYHTSVQNACIFIDLYTKIDWI